MNVMALTLVTDYLLGLAGLMLVMLVATFALVIVGRWAHRKRGAWHERWHRLIQKPGVARLEKRFAGPLAWIRRRLSPGEFLGLHLTAGALILLGFGWAFGELTEDVMANDSITIIDQNVADYLHANELPIITKVMSGVTFLGSATFIIVIVILASSYLVLRKSWYRLATLIFAVAGGALLNLLLKQLIQRDRPLFENPLITLTNYSFPSGHTMGATLIYGTLAAFVVISKVSWKWKIATTYLAALLIILIAFSRLYLGAHFLSDVIGAMAAGFAWLTLCVTAVDTLRRRKLADSIKT